MILSQENLGLKVLAAPPPGRQFAQKALHSAAISTRNAETLTRAGSRKTLFFLNKPTNHPSESKRQWKSFHTLSKQCIILKRNKCSRNNLTTQPKSKTLQPQAVLFPSKAQRGRSPEDPGTSPWVPTDWWL